MYVKMWHQLQLHLIAKTCKSLYIRRFFNYLNIQPKNIRKYLVIRQEIENNKYSLINYLYLRYYF